MNTNLSLLAAAVVTWAGCVSQPPLGQAPQPGERLPEHRQTLREVSKVMANALSCLKQVNGQASRCPPRLVAALAAEVQDVQVESLKVRSRWHAMEARGEAYFQHWHESLALVRDS